MTYDTFNLFIKNYIENDKTGRAVMLKSDWGTGKSYYINHTLKPFLKSDDGGKHDCVIVSLYGLTNISDISKSIYLELRSIGKSNNTEMKSTGKAVAKIVGKTIFNGFINKIGFDIGSVDDNDLQDVYESIDLTGKLIILDDFERSGIDRILLFGYINNLCEQDGVKVLLIANESELIHRKEIIPHKDEKQEITKPYTDETLLYLKAREKTIGDTINFVCDYDKAIKSIIDLFNDPDLSEFSECITSEEIGKVDLSYPYHIFHPYKNLRAFVQTCQKSSDIFRFMREKGITVNREIKSVILYGLMRFIDIISKYEIPEFPSNQYVASNLGYSYKYPLFKFCYDYVVWKILDEDEIRNVSQYYKEYVLHGAWSAGKDSDLLVIRNCYNCTEKEIVNAIQNIQSKLQNNDIPYYDYGILISYLVCIKYEIQIDFDLAKIEEYSLMNIRKKGDTIKDSQLFNGECVLYNEDAKKDFNDYKNRVFEALKDDIVNIGFNYRIDNVDSLCNEMKKKTPEQLKTNGYAKNLDIDGLINFMKQCSSENINRIRLGFYYLYSGKSRIQLHPDDIVALCVICERIEELKSYECFDRVQKYLVSIFSEQLREIIDKLS